MDNSIVPTTSGGCIKKKISDIYDGEYFQVLFIENDMLIVRCNSCPPTLQLRTSIKSNGNIIKHIQRRHPELLNKIRNEKNIKCRRPTPLIGSTTDSQSNNQRDEKNVKHFTIENGSNVMREGLNEYSSNNCDIDETYEMNSSTNKSHHKVIREIVKHSNVKPFDNIHNKGGGGDDDEYDDNVDNEEYYDDGGGDNDDDDEKNRTDEMYMSPTDTNNKTKFWPTSAKVINNSSVSNEVVSLQKELMLREYEDIQDMRRQKHRLEIEILRQDLEFKKIEHRKKIELLEKKLKH